MFGHILANTSNYKFKKENKSSEKSIFLTQLMFDVLIVLN